MLKELLLEAPSWLEENAQGRFMGPVRLTNHDFSRWPCTCRFESSRAGELAFAADGTGRLELSGGHGGPYVVVLELSEPEDGGRYVGAFQLVVDDSGGPGRRPAVYRTLDEAGTPVPVRTVVDDKAMLRIPLLAERPSRAVMLADLLGRERCLPLPERTDGSARVSTIHTGDSTVVGRCYGSQLKGRARDYLEALGESSIHWVTLWDDRWVNKISARLHYQLEGGEHRLGVTNLTDYSQAQNDLRVRLGAGGEQRISPGATLSLTLAPDVAMNVMVGEGEHGRSLFSCRFVERRLGRVRLPFFQTVKTRFQFPPEDPQGLEMRYLGIWLPLPRDRFERLLSVAGEPLTVGFPEEATFFWFRYRHARQVVAVTSNEDLRSGLAR